MGNGCSVQSDALCRAEMGQGTFGKIRAIVGDDAVWDAVPSCDVTDEGHCSRTIQLLDGFHLHPLGELVHCDKQVSQATSCRLEWSYHAQTPDCKWPGDGDSLECGSWLKRLGTENLAPLALLD